MALLWTTYWGSCEYSRQKFISFGSGGVGENPR